ncbi:MAG TPA: iron-sulfur cluster repair di-iron protein [Chryseolinea sp.]|nr:iron-sulfur cluster repair di-iron protein [Chryseolinea sp.]HPH47295.1 iron-sulfur cluster repair di-iron protein [Chryseolinea sp.]HPM31896.1 iron-sulfur cluster repair di-iron protein [Chryseolinea sp.]
MTITDDQLLESITVAEVALNFPQALEILQRHNLDYCCGGKKPFVQVCEKAGLDVDVIWQELQNAKANHGGDKRMRFDTWHAPLLIDFILQHHHSYVRESIPQIQELLDKVCNVHGEDSPFLLAVRENFSSLAEELLDHLPKEEEILFPAIRKLFNQQDESYDLGFRPSNLQAPISVMEHEHDSAGHLVKEIRRITNAYTPPAYACPTFKATYIMLEQFDQDLMQHIHLENNILFPKAKEAQNKINNL